MVRALSAPPLPSSRRWGCYSSPPTRSPAACAAPDAPRVASLAYGYLTVLLVPLRTPDAVVGHLCLGPKASGEPFRAEDHALLATLSGHLAALVRNTQFADELRAQVDLLEAQRATLDTLNERLERAHLVADIHDEPLQTALYLRRQLTADGRGRAATAQHLALSQALVNQLHALCTAVRPAALDELGLAGAIEILALDLTERAGADAGVSIRLDIDAEFAGAPLPPGADVVLYRTAQEALNNSLRHARPRHRPEPAAARRHGRALYCRRRGGLRRARAGDDLRRQATWGWSACSTACSGLAAGCG